MSLLDRSWVGAVLPYSVSDINKWIGYTIGLLISTQYTEIDKRYALYLSDYLLKNMQTIS